MVRPRPRRTREKESLDTKDCTPLSSTVMAANRAIVSPARQGRHAYVSRHVIDTHLEPSFLVLNGGIL